MGREVKRVAAGFVWPLSKVWSGFVDNPNRGPKKCLACKGSGSSAVARHLGYLWYGYAPFKPEDRGSKPHRPTDEHVLNFARRNVTRNATFYGSGDAAVMREAQRLATHWNSGWSHHLNQNDVNALVADGRLHDFTHNYSPDTGWQPKHPPYIPTAQEVNVWSCGGMGHDCINQWIVVRAECKRLGVHRACGRCGGSGQIWSSRGARKRYEGWERTGPPSGDWWQVWETVSEGSPVTPAFATREQLVDYLVENGDHWDQKRGDGGWGRDNAELFVESEWAPSLITAGGQVYAPRDGALPRVH